jgi:DNA-binding transcriptional MerR regulator
MNDILSKLPLFIANDSVDEDFVSYFDEENSKLHKLIREKRYTVKDTDISSRVINHWDDKGLLPDGVQVEEEKWRKFSFVEIVWLEVVKTLRGFGLSLDAIKKVKDQILSWNVQEGTYTWFEYYVIKSASSPLDGYLVLSPEDKSSLIFSRHMESSKSVFGSRTLLLVSLKKMVSNLKVSTVEPESLISLSEDEVQLLGEVRDPKVSAVSLKMKDGKLKNLISSEIVSGDELGSIKKELEENNMFFDVLERSENGKVQSAEIRKKRKF